MMLRKLNSRIVTVVSAMGLLLLLAASLAVRVSARSDAPVDPLATGVEPSPGHVPAPRPILPAELPTPFCWGCGWNENAPLEFQLDLDLLAPLGDGTSNAASWFAQFGGDSPAASGGYRERRVELTIDGREWTVLPGNDPLLLAAEPWVNQATLSFYPEIWDIRSFDISLPNLLMMIDLAKSWVARGKLADDAARARADFRRAIRIGRLLRQDDVTLIQDLVAIACIRVGVEAFYELARSEGDAATMTAAALVLADKDAMRQRTAQHITTLERAVRFEDPEVETIRVRLSNAELDAIIELMRDVPERRFRMEGLIGMHAVMHLGTPAQREAAVAVLEEYATSDDELTAALARHSRDTALDVELLRGMVPILFVGPGTLGRTATHETSEEAAKDAREPARKLACPAPADGLPGCVEALKEYDRNVDSIRDVTFRSRDELQVSGRAQELNALANLVSEMISCAAFSDFKPKRIAATDSDEFEFILVGHCHRSSPD